MSKLTKIIAMLSFIGGISAFSFAGEGWVDIPNDKIVIVGVVGNTTAFGFKSTTSGSIGLDISNTVTLPFTLPTVNNTAWNTYYSFCGQKDQDEANVQMLAVMMAAVKSGKGLRLYIKEDDGTSQMQGRVMILTALMKN